jgi:glutaryl-CoA dehydrogenase
MPRVREAYNKEYFDTNILKEMGEMGFLGCTLTGNLGDGVELMGTSYTAYGLINREIERVDSGYRSALSVQSSLVMYPIAKFLRDEELKKRLLR